MLPLTLWPQGRPPSVLALGAHADDVEIGAGGTLLHLARQFPGLDAHVVVLTGSADRAAEARTSAAAFLAPATPAVTVHDLPDGRLPMYWGDVKTVLDDLAVRLQPDLVLAPHRHDAHQDHRTLAELVTTAFRDHLVLRYEVLKWDGDLGAAPANLYVPLDAATMQRKTDLLLECFPSQRARDWFEPASFAGLARVRGVQCKAPYAEAFSVDKVVLALDGRDARS